MKDNGSFSWAILLASAYIGNDAAAISCLVEGDNAGAFVSLFFMFSTAATCLLEARRYDKS